MNTAPTKLDHIEVLRDIQNEYRAYDNSHHQVAALDAAIAALAPPSGEGVDDSVRLDFIERNRLAVSPLDGGCWDVTAFDAGDSHETLLASRTTLRGAIDCAINDGLCAQDYTTPPPASQERGVAPWPDFAGNPIHAGDRIKHPDGVSGTVVFLPMLGAGGDAWRVAYDGEVTLSRLALQIGDKGQAVVVSPKCGTCGEAIKSNHLTGTICACAAKPARSAASNRVCDEKCDDEIDAVFAGIDAAEQAKPDGYANTEHLEACRKRIKESGAWPCGAEQAQAGERVTTLPLWEELNLEAALQTNPYRANCLREAATIICRLNDGVMVDDAMVERGCAAMAKQFGQQWPNDYDDDEITKARDAMRSGLVAALEAGRG